LVFGGKAVYYDVKADSAKLDEMLTYTKGARKVPVIVEYDKVSIGYEGGS
jgi:glutaredoxin